VRPAALLAAAALVLTISVPAAARTQAFRAPSKNIYCLYSSKGGPGPYIRCDVLSLNDVGFTLDRSHRGKRVKVTDAVVDAKARVLRYGTSRRFGSFRCSSRRSGLTCRSTKSRHGFELSRQKQHVF
jgi:uncharacterized protein DUF6636